MSKTMFMKVGDVINVGDAGFDRNGDRATGSAVVRKAEFRITAMTDSGYTLECVNEPKRKTKLARR